MITNKRVLVNKSDPSIFMGMCADEIINGMSGNTVRIFEVENGYNLIGANSNVKTILVPRKEEFEWKIID